MLTDLALKWLRAAGYEVTPADGVPGLWDIDGLARDVTINQLFQLATRHGNISPAERSVLLGVASQTFGITVSGAPQA